MRVLSVLVLVFIASLSLADTAAHAKNFLIVDNKCPTNVRLFIRHSPSAAETINSGWFTFAPATKEVVKKNGQPIIHLLGRPVYIYGSDGPDPGSFSGNVSLEFKGRTYKMMKVDPDHKKGNSLIWLDCSDH